MFNLYKFNTSRENLLGASSTLLLTASPYETITSVIVVADNALYSMNATESVSSDTGVIGGVILASTLSEAFSGNATLLGMLPLLTDSQEIVSAEVVLGASMLECQAPAEAVTGQHAIGSSIRMSVHAAENVAASCAMSAVQYMPAKTYFEIMSAACFAEATDVDTILLDITLEPNDVLVIDSEKYEITLNGENVLDKHSGEWLDELDRNIRTVQIDSGTAATLTGTFTYRERWL